MIPMPWYDRAFSKVDSILVLSNKFSGELAFKNQIKRRATIFIYIYTKIYVYTNMYLYVYNTYT